MRATRRQLQPRGLASIAPDHSRPRAVPALAVGAQALGAVALGTIALGAVAVATLAIGRLAVGKARIRRLHIDELVVRRVRVVEQLSLPDDATRDAQAAITE
jgi:hypothetical protein